MCPADYMQVLDGQRSFRDIFMTFSRPGFSRESDSDPLSPKK